MSSSVNIDNRNHKNNKNKNNKNNKNIDNILGEGSTQGLDGTTLTPKQNIILILDK